MRPLHIICHDPKIDITVEMGDGPATPTAGSAGWEVIDRVEGKGVTDQGPVPPFQQSVPIFLDGYAKGNSVQRQLDELLRAGGEDAGIFRADGPIHKPWLRYVLGGEPDYGEVIRDDDGTLLRQRLTLPFMEYVPPNVLRRPNRRAGIGQARALTYTVREAETLARITHKVLGDWKRWREIGDKNRIRDPFAVLTPGRVLKL